MEIINRLESEVRGYVRSFPKVFTHAKANKMTTEDGAEYLDFFSGAGALNYGHNDEVMKKALLEYIESDGVTHGLDMATDAKQQFLATFEDVIMKPRNMAYKIQFPGPTGTNAVEAAMKLARKVTGRHNIVAFTNGFHGMTMGALAATGNSGKRGGGAMPLQGVTHMPYDGAFGEDTDTLKQIEWMLDNPSSGLDAPAAFIVEPVQGEGGLNAASKEWMQGIARLAKKHGALLIADDIQAGIGRTGTFFSFEEFGIEPDLIPLAKSLSGMGLPFAALLVKPELDIWKPAEHNGTFRGNTHAFVTARVALEKFWKDDAFQEELKKKARIVEIGLTSIADMVDGARLKGRGLMRGVDVGSGELASEICAEAFKRGLIIETSGAHDEVVKVLAPLTTTDEQFAKGFEILRDATRAALTETSKIAAE